MFFYIYTLQEKEVILIEDEKKLIAIEHLMPMEMSFCCKVPPAANFCQSCGEKPSVHPFLHTLICGRGITHQNYQYRRKFSFCLGDLYQREEC